MERSSAVAAGEDADGEAQLGGDAAEVVDDDALLLSGDGFTASDSMEYGYGDWEDGEDVEAADVDDFLRATMDPEGAASGEFNLDGVGGGVSWDSAAEGMDLESFLSTLGADSVMAEDAKLGTVDSHELVELDEDGEPYFERFVFVDEASCIGCTNCACVAPATFFMEDDYGRAGSSSSRATRRGSSRRPSRPAPWTASTTCPGRSCAASRASGAGSSTRTRPSPT